MEEKNLNELINEDVESTDDEKEEKEEKGTKEPEAETKAPVEPQKDNSSPERLRQLSKYANSVKIRGNIEKMSISKDGRTALVTMCARASMTQANYPTIVFFGDIEERVKQFKIGERVIARAHLQSYDEKKLRPGQSPVLIVGDSLSREKPSPRNEVFEDEGDLKPIENVYYKDENLMEVKGQILAIECSRNGDISLTMRINPGYHPSIIKFPYIARDKELFLKNIHVHEFVKGVGTVQTANVPGISEETRHERAANVERAANIRDAMEQPRIRTHKRQYFLLYDIYTVSNSKN